MNLFLLSSSRVVSFVLHIGFFCLRSCVYANDWKFSLGIHELINSLAPSLPSRVEVYTASQVHIHEQYDSRTLDYDIALVSCETLMVKYTKHTSLFCNRKLFSMTWSGHLVGMEIRVF